MQCPKCGYEMGPFDEDCKRCRNMARGGEVSSPQSHSQSVSERQAASPSGVVADGAGNSVAKTVGALLIAGIIWWLISGGATGWSQARAIEELDGQHVSLDGRVTHFYRDGISWSGTIEITEGPLKGIEFTGGGIDFGSAVGSGSSVTVTGTFRQSGDGTISITGMQVLPK